MRNPSTTDKLLFTQLNNFNYHHSNYIGNASKQEDPITQLLISPISIIRRNLLKANSSSWDSRKSSYHPPTSLTSLESLDTESNSIRIEIPNEDRSKSTHFCLKENQKLKPYVPENKQHLFFYVLAHEIQKYRPRIVKHEKIWTHGDNIEESFEKTESENKKRKHAVQHPDPSSMCAPPPTVRFDSFSNSQLRCITIDDCGEVWDPSQYVRLLMNQIKPSLSPTSKYNSENDYEADTKSSKSDDDVLGETKDIVNPKLIYEHRKYVNRPLRFLKAHGRPNPFTNRHQNSKLSH